MQVHLLLAASAALLRGVTERAITATLITDGVIQLTLDRALDRGLSVELTDSGLDVSHWIEAR